MSDDSRLSPLGAEMVAGLSAFHDALASGEPIENRFTVRIITLDLQTKTTGSRQGGHIIDDGRQTE